MPHPNDLGVISLKKDQRDATEAADAIESPDRTLSKRLKNEDNQQLRGILCLSGYLPRAMKALQGFERLKTESPARAAVIANDDGKRRKTPILMCHGLADPMVDIHAARASKEFVTHNFGSQFDVRLETFPNMAHEACQEEADLVAEWLGSMFPKEDSSRL